LRCAHPSCTCQAAGTVLPFSTSIADVVLNRLITAEFPTSTRPAETRDQGHGTRVMANDRDAAIDLPNKVLRCLLYSQRIGVKRPYRK
jgi:hypothetical protein